MCDRILTRTVLVFDNLGQKYFFFCLSFCADSSVETPVLALGVIIATSFSFQMQKIALSQPVRKGSYDFFPALLAPGAGRVRARLGTLARSRRVARRQLPRRAAGKNTIPKPLFLTIFSPLSAGGLTLRIVSGRRRFCSNDDFIDGGGFALSQSIRLLLLTHISGDKSTYTVSG